MGIMVYEPKSQTAGLDGNEVQIANAFPFVST
jgi:hypothetical protein